MVKVHLFFCDFINWLCYEYLLLLPTFTFLQNVFVLFPLYSSRLLSALAVCKVMSNTQLEALAVARWAALVGYASHSLETALKGISGGGESCIKRQIIPDCGCKVAEGSFAKFSGEPWTIKKLVS